MSFDTAVSGIKASSASLGIIGNNIANAGTTGFKSSRGEFSDVFSASLMGNSANSFGKGVSVAGVSQSFAQGNISYTDNALDMAISGNGFFVLDDGGSNLYSRAGNFDVDRAGYVVNGGNHKLMVFETTEDGQVTGQMSPLKVDAALFQPKTTGAVEVQANLDSRDTQPPVAWPGGGVDAFAVPATAPSPDMYNASTSVTVYDSLGNSHVQSLYFAKTATENEWEVHSTIDGVSVTGPDTLTFGADGKIAAADKPLQISVSGWTPLDETGAANGASAQDFTVDLSALSQFGNEFGVNSVLQDGYTTGQLNGVDVAEGGLIFARYTNGQSRTLGQVAMANFTNISGLQPLGNASWSETFASGQPTIAAPGTSGLGNVQSGALEDSNVEVTKQLVDMIVAQRNFQANAKVIQAEDTVTQAVINLR